MSSVQNFHDFLHLLQFHSLSASLGLKISGPGQQTTAYTVLSGPGQQTTAYTVLTDA